MTITQKQNFTSAFFIIASNFQWGRHLDLVEALKIAGVKADDKKVSYLITTFLFKEDTTDEIRQNILNCYCVNSFGSIVRCNGLEQVDIDQINEYLIGWTYYRHEIKSSKKS